MPVLEGRIGPDGATADVVVRPSSFAREFRPELAGRAVRARALFDTGSDITHLQTGLARRLGIHPHEAVTVSGIHDRSRDCAVYDVDLELPEAGILLPDLRVVESSFEAVGRERIDVILGRSVLVRGRFLFDGWNGRFSFEVADAGGRAGPTRANRRSDPPARREGRPPDM